MAVTQEITHLENSAVKLTFTYNNEELCAKYNTVVGDFAKDMQIKGFRKGKAPISVLERKLGKLLQEDALNSIIADTVNEAIKSEYFPKDALPLSYSDPKVEGEPKLDLSSELVFSVKYDVAPQVTVGQWEGLDVEVETAELTDADVERELNQIRERNAIVMDKEDDEAAENGDVVTVNYSELDEKGGEIPSSKREDFTFTLGSGHNFFKFDDEIIGMKKDETRDIQKTYPEDSDDELAGKTKQIRVTVTALKRREIPDDDELVQDIDESFQAIVDLKQYIRKNLERDLEERLERIKINRIIEKIVEQNPPSIPESMIAIEMFNSLRQAFGMFNIQNADTTRFAQEAMKDETRRLEAVKRIQASLVRDKLIQQLNIEVSEEELERNYENIAEESGTSFEEVKEKYEMDGEVNEYLISDIKHDMLNKLLLEKNTIKPGRKVNLMDIFEINS
ncbi:MAG: trigger factor [Spirochaetaceae bacterium]|nr:trigger factor [Spirochaetaceae bacterium]